jgi:hypothetical protein
MIHDNKLPPQNKPKSSIHTIVVIVKPSNQANQHNYSIHPISKKKAKGETENMEKPTGIPIILGKQTTETRNKSTDKQSDKQTPFPTPSSQFLICSQTDRRQILWKHNSTAWLSPPHSS